MLSPYRYNPQATGALTSGKPLLITGGSSSSLTIGDAITGGTTTRVLFEGTGNVLAEDAGFTYVAGTDALTVLGSIASPLVIAGTAVTPDTNDGAALGTTALQFSDLFLAEGAVINWDNGDATLTQSGNMVTLAGADFTADNIIVNTALLPDANDGAAIGSTTLQFSDLFLAEGGVINWDNGDATITQAGNVVTLAGADLVVSGTAQVATTLGVGAATPAASGAGITFPATASASTDVNTLDDYEEGSWTPIDSSGAGLSFSSVTGNYTRIGNTVRAGSRFLYPANASGTATKVGGLPFTIFNEAGSGQGFAAYNNGAVSIAYVFGLINTTTFEFYNNAAGSSIANVDQTGAQVVTTVLYKGA